MPLLQNEGRFFALSRCLCREDLENVLTDVDLIMRKQLVDLSFTFIKYHPLPLATKFSRILIGLN